MWSLSFVAHLPTPSTKSGINPQALRWGMGDSVTVSDQLQFDSLFPRQSSSKLTVRVQLLNQVAIGISHIDAANLALRSCTFHHPTSLEYLDLLLLQPLQYLVNRVLNKETQISAARLNILTVSVKLWRLSCCESSNLCLGFKLLPTDM